MPPLPLAPYESPQDQPPSPRNVLLTSVRGGVMSGNAYRVLNVPRVRVIATAAQSINNGALTALNFDASLVAPAYATDSMYDTSVRTRVTIKTPGVYAITTYVCWSGSAAGTNRQAFAQINGSVAALSRFAYDILPPSAVIQVLTGSDQASFNTGDYLELIVFQDSGGALSTNTNTGVSPAAMLCLCLISTLG